MAKCSIGVVLLLILLSCSSSREKQEKAELYLRMGNGHLSKGHYPQALRDLLEAEKLDPENPVVQNSLGIAYFARKNYDLALQHVGEAVKLNPSYSDARNNYGRICIELTRYDEAIKELNLVVKDLTYPMPEKAYVNLGLAYLKRGEAKASANYFGKSIEANSRYCPAHNYYGQSLFQLQKYDEAIDSFENALRLCNNNYDEAHYFSALSYYKAGQKEKAHARLEEVVKLYPDSEFAAKAKAMLKIVQ